MKLKTKLLLSSIPVAGLFFSLLIAQPGGLDDFKLQNFSLTKHLHNQIEALDDL